MELRVENLIYEYNAGTAYAKRALNGIDLEFHERLSSILTDF